MLWLREFDVIKYLLVSPLLLVRHLTPRLVTLGSAPP